MKKKLFGLLACILLLAVLGVVYYFVSQPKEANADEDTATESPSYELANRNKDDLVKINLNGSDNMTISLDESGNWVSDNYPDIPIKQSAVTAILTYIAALTTDKLVAENAENLSDYGLSPATLTVTGYYSDGTSETLLVGNQTSAKDYYYITKPGDNNVYMILNYTANLFRRTYTDFVDVSSPEMDLSNLRYLYFYNGKVPLEANYRNINETASDNPSIYSSAMFATTPINGKSLYLDNVQGYISDFLANITFSEMVEVVSSGDEKYGFDDPKLKIVFDGITFDDEGNENGTFYYQLVIGNDVEDNGDYAYAKFGKLPCVYTVEKSMLTDLYAANPYKMLDKFVTLVYINNVDSILVDTPDSSHIMKINGYKSYSDENETTSYDEIAPTVDGIVVKDSLFRDFYQLIVGLNYDSVIEDFTPSGTPVLTVTYKLLADVEDNVTNYYEYDTNFYAIEQNGECHFAISKSYVERMLRNIEVMKSGAEELDY